MTIKKYRSDIDGLRSIAVIAVIVGHYWPGFLQSGFLGVDIFFVISGYVITSSLYGRDESSFKVFLISFYSRRMKRLLPALLACILVSSVIGSMLIPNPVGSLKTAFSAIFGFSNIYLLYTSVDYFGLASEFNLFTHTWSLGVEEQFYLVFPALFWFVYRGNKSASKNKRYISILVVVSLVSFVLLNQYYEKLAYFFTPIRIWEFAVGIFVYYKRTKIKQSYDWLAPIAFTGMIFLFFLPVEFQNLATVSVVMATGTVMLCNNTNKAGLYRMLSYQPVLWIGLRSYSLYLWHWPILVLFKMTVGLNFYTSVIALILSFVIAHVSYTYIEQPFRGLKDDNILRNGIFALLGAAALVFILAKPLNGYLSVLPKYTGIAPVHSALICREGSMDTCIKRKDNKKHIFIIGDSHATNLVPSINNVANKNGVRVSYFGGIQFIRSIFNNKNCVTNLCYEDELKQIQSLFDETVRPGDIVMFSMSRSRLYLPSRYVHEGKSRNGFENIEKIKLLKDALFSLKKITLSRKATLIFVDDVPAICSPHDFVRINFTEDACIIDNKESIDDRAPLTKLYQSLLDEKTLYVDPHSALCNDEKCKFFVDNKPIYSDTSPHISEVNKYVLAPFFEQFFIQEKER